MPLLSQTMTFWPCCRDSVETVTVSFCLMLLNGNWNAMASEHKMQTISKILKDWSMKWEEGFYFFHSAMFAWTFLNKIGSGSLLWLMRALRTQSHPDGQSVQGMSLECTAGRGLIKAASHRLLTQSPVVGGIKRQEVQWTVHTQKEDGHNSHLWPERSLANPYIGWTEMWMKTHTFFGFPLLHRKCHSFDQLHK